MKISTPQLAKELMARGLIPDNCRLVEVSIPRHGALIIRYEVFVEADRFALFADAMKAAAQHALTSHRTEEEVT